jgi:mRNA interferase MazF
MRETDVALTPLPQADGRIKNRPVIALRQMPPFGDWLVCGISTQLQQQVPGFDDIIERTHPDFADSGLKASSLVRLGFLAVLPTSSLVGVIGSISPDRHRLLLQRLAQHLRPNEVA